MINQTEQTFLRLDNLNIEQRRISYQMSTGKILENGSDDANLYARELYVDDKIRTYEGLKTQVSKTTAQNNISDSATSEIKKMLELIQSELIKANTSTTTDDGRKSIAAGIAGIKENLFDLANTQVEGEYLFSGSNSATAAFVKDSSGNVTYNGDNGLRNVAVEENSYRERGINGIELMMYATDTATISDPNLSFKETEVIIDQDGYEWKLDGAKTSLERFDLEGNATGETIAGVTNDAGTPPTYTATIPLVNGTHFEAKTNIFDIVDDIVDGLNKVDSLGNPVSDAVSKAAIGKGLSDIGEAYDSVNVAHAELGGKNKIFEIALEKVSSKLTQFNILSQEIGAADLGKVAMEAKALELTYTALYSTINRTNELSLVNFLR